MFKNFKPNLTIYFDIEPKISINRIKKRGKLDNMEKKNKNIFKNIRAAYLKEIKNDPNIIFINSNKSKNHVKTEISYKLNYWLNGI